MNYKSCDAVFLLWLLDAGLFTRGNMNTLAGSIASHLMRGLAHRNDYIFDYIFTGPFIRFLGTVAG